MTFQCSLMRVVHKESLHCGVCRGISASAFGLIGRGTRLGAENPELWAIQIILSLHGSGRAILADAMSLSSDDDQIRRQPVSVSALTCSRQLRTPRELLPRSRLIGTNSPSSVLFLDYPLRASPSLRRKPTSDPNSLLVYRLDGIL